MIQGDAVIRFRSVLDNEILTYKVSGNKMDVVDIPPGYAHSIENIGNGEMIVIFWANQIFDPQQPDTYSSEI